jgi:aspartate aminotransferase-like enzyme
MKKRYLVTPGPSPVPQEVRLALAAEIIHHRTTEFQNYLTQAMADLKTIFRTKNDTFIMSASGTGAMEASVANVVGRGEKAITIEAGKFGERWTELVKAYGGTPIVLKVEWGRGPKPEDVARLLAENPDAKAVYATLCETSTATRQDIEALGKVVAATKALLVVDGISGAGAMEMRTDDWHVDMLAVGSQKALMLPPGLAFITVSAKAWEVVKATKRTAYYFDLIAAKKAAEKNDTPYTSAVSLIRGLCEATKMITADGMDAVVARHSLLAKATRAAVKAMGLEVYSKDPADAVTAIVLPAGMDGKALEKTLASKYGVTVAGGQGDLVGKVIRVAHMGYMDKFDVITAFAAIEMALNDMGHKVKLGSGVAAAQEVFLNAR